MSVWLFIISYEKVPFSGSQWLIQCHGTNWKRPMYHLPEGLHCTHNSNVMPLFPSWCIVVPPQAVAMTTSAPNNTSLNHLHSGEIKAPHHFGSLRLSFPEIIKLLQKLNMIFSCCQKALGCFAEQLIKPSTQFPREMQVSLMGLLYMAFYC